MSAIGRSVGEGGINRRRDVFVIQHLLNRHRAERSPLLRTDSIAGARTIAAIREFQERIVHLRRVDGRVDPGGPTLRKLRLAPYQVRRPTPHPATAARLAPPTASLAPERRSPPHGRVADDRDIIAWGARVSPRFKRKVQDIADRLDISPDFLMSCMAFESGETFSPSIRNAAGSGAVGLIQFMPSTARALRTSSDELAAMSPERQLDFVELYFRPYRGRIRTIEDIYMTILFPRAIGRPADYTLFSGQTTAYRQNKGLDSDRDGAVSKYEAAAAVRAKYQKGMRPGYIG